MGLGPSFLNAAVRVVFEPARSARSIVAALLAIEHQLGRVRTRGEARNEPRTLDLDLLWTSDAPSAHPDAVVPHPRLHERAFALAPLVDVAPEATDPTGVSYAAHLARTNRAGVDRVAPTLD